MPFVYITGLSVNLCVRKEQLKEVYFLLTDWHANYTRALKSRTEEKIWNTRNPSVASDSRIHRLKEDIIYSVTCISFKFVNRKKTLINLVLIITYYIGRRLICGWH